MIILALIVAALVLLGAEAAFLHGRTRFFHPAMWTPAAFGLLAAALGLWLAAGPAALARLAFYYLLWVGLLAGLAGEIFHLRRAARALRQSPAHRYRTLAMGAPLSLPLLFTLLSLLGLRVFSLLP